jgi:hypothetical protein
MRAPKAYCAKAERNPHHMMKPPSQVRNGENYPSFDSLIAGVIPARLILERLGSS